MLLLVCRNHSHGAECWHRPWEMPQCSLYLLTLLKPQENTVTSLQARVALLWSCNACLCWRRHLKESVRCWDGSTSLAPHSSLLTQTQSKEKASAKLPPAPAVAAGRQWELSTADSHICPWLVVKELAQDTASTGGTQNLHPGGSLLLFFKVPVLVHVSWCHFRGDITSEP